MFEWAQWLGASPLSIAVQSRLWLTPLLQSIHILMIGVVFVAILMIALRVLGRVSTDEPFAAVWQRFAPWLWRGLTVMAVTGVILAVGEPVRQATALSFWLKMSLLIIAVASAGAFGHSLRRTAVAEPSFSTAEKAGAVLTVAIWLAIIFLGRAIAYDVEVWGALHLGS